MPRTEFQFKIVRRSTLLMVCEQDKLKIVPGTTRAALAGLQGETLGPGTVESQAALFSGGKRATSLVASKDRTQESTVPSPNCRARETYLRFCSSQRAAFFS